MSQGEPPPAPPKDMVVDHSSLFQSARRQMAARDAEAMRRARWAVPDSSDSEPPSSRSSHGHGSLLSPGTGSIRRSSLSRQLGMTEAAPNSPQQQQQQTHSEESVSLRTSPRAASNYVIAVVGHEGVGKTTVIRRAVKSWSGSAPVTTYTPEGHAISSSFAQIKAGGKLAHDCNVEFVEVNLKALDLSGVAQVWPAGMSPVSGAILCYDAERRDTLRGLSEALHQLCPALPMVLFACKSDPDKKLEVDAQVGDSIGQPYNVGLIEVTTAATAQGKHKMRAGLRWLLYRLEERQRREARRSDPNACGAQPLSTTSSPKPNDNSESDSFPWLRHSNRDDFSDAHSSSSSLGWMMKGNRQSATTVSTENSVDSTPTLEGEKSAGAAISIPATVTPADSNDAQGYTSQSELMTRLFTAIVSTENDSFVNAFCMTYRRFCHPSELMAEFLDRFVEVEGYPVSRDIRMWALMKLAGALLDWVTRYPGDLSDPETRSLFQKTVSCMLKYTFLGHITDDLALIEGSVEGTPDVDISWSCRRSKDPPTLTVVVGNEDLREDYESSINTPRDEPLSTRSIEESIYSKRPMASDQTTTTTDSSSDLSRSIYSGDDTGHQRWSQAFHAVLQMDPYTFALELTRMQWEMFSVIRPRDVLRHDLGKERDEPVSRSIDFFNHVARFVSTMVLASPKPKNRARVYEAFVKIAHQLRRLNNYDSLSAVISGLRETSVHRLGETHKLVRLEPTLARDFQSHMRLMDPRGGYVIYRRALQADSTYGHTAIPLLSAVLSLVSRLQAGRPEDRRPSDSFVQWGKFQRFGEILAVIPDFQSRGPMVPGTASASFRRLIEATPVIPNEDGLYERSKLIEPGGIQGTNMLRKLAANLAL